MFQANPRIAVIGAGISGLACASRLREAGAAVAVFDKSGDIGGRLAARRRGGGVWHHGAPAVQAREPTFQRFLKDQADAGRAVVADSYGGGLFARGLPDMRELTRGLLTGLDFNPGFELSRLAVTERGWLLIERTGQQAGPFDVVLTAVPAPQLGAILEQSRLPVPEALGEVRMAPCWSFLVGFDTPPPEWSPAHQAFPSLVTMKPRDRSELPYCFVLQAAADWSRGHLEASRDEAILLLKRDLGGSDAGRDWLDRAAQIRAHRWRYAVTERALGRTHLFDPITGLGHTGDWCTGSTAEAGYLNGRALGAAVVRSASEYRQHA
jgi:predicted NAD/FAD-dependent oxidoreductase